MGGGGGEMGARWRVGVQLKCEHGRWGRAQGGRCRTNQEATARARQEELEDGYNLWALATHPAPALASREGETP